MVLGKCRGRNASLAAFFLQHPLLGLSHSAITSISHSPPLSASHLLLRALDECGGLITFFRERISMSCPECFALMHKEQAARAPKNGGRGIADTSSISQSVTLSRGGGVTKNCTKWSYFYRATWEKCMLLDSPIFGRHRPCLQPDLKAQKWSHLWLRSGKRERDRPSAISPCGMWAGWM